MSSESDGNTIFELDMMTMILEQLHRRVQDRFRSLWDRWPARSIRVVPVAVSGYKIMVCYADPTPRVPSIDDPGELPDGVKAIDFPVDWEHFTELELILRASYDMQPDDFFVACPLPKDMSAYQRWPEYFRALPERDKQFWSNTLETVMMRQLTTATDGRHDVHAETAVADPIRSRHYRRQTNFLPPKNLDQRIWRYMSLAKYLDILVNGRLWFAAPHTMDDDWEGALGMPNLLDEKGVGSTRPIRPAPLYLSCWHAQEVESVAMWTQYARWGVDNREGVAVASTYRRLFESIEEDWAGYGVLGGEVNYVDYENTYIGVGNIFDRYMNKRPSFAHEREIRFAVPSTDSLDLDGLHVPVRTSDLISEVRTAPRAPEWFVSLVAAASSGLGSTVDVLRSAMDAPPPGSGDTRG